MENSRHFTTFAQNLQKLIMTYDEFTTIFLPQLADHYQKGSLPFHALVDVDLWKRVFPDLNAAPNQVQWYNVKLEAFDLNDREGTLLLTYSLPIRFNKKEAKFIAMRIDNMSHTLSYYILRRPSSVNDYWDIFQYNFATGKEVYVNKLDSTDSLREFRNYLATLPADYVAEEETFIQVIKKQFNPRNLFDIALT